MPEQSKPGYVLFLWSILLGSCCSGTDCYSIRLHPEFPLTASPKMTVTGEPAYTSVIAQDLHALMRWERKISWTGHPWQFLTGPDLLPLPVSRFLTAVVYEINISEAACWSGVLSCTFPGSNTISLRPAFFQKPRHHRLAVLFHEAVHIQKKMPHSTCHFGNTIVDCDTSLKSPYGAEYLLLLAFIQCDFPGAGLKEGSALSSLILRLPVFDDDIFSMHLAPCKSVPRMHLF